MLFQVQVWRDGHVVWSRQGEWNEEAERELPLIRAEAASAVPEWDDILFVDETSPLFVLVEDHDALGTAKEE